MHSDTVDCALCVVIQIVCTLQQSGKKAKSINPTQIIARLCNCLLVASMFLTTALSVLQCWA